MDKIFARRRNTWRTQSLKYLRYVFNDHFVLFLMILLGALVVQYVQFLHNHSLNSWEKAILVLLISGISLLFGRLATFVEAADKVFLLAQEKQVKKILTKSLVRSLIGPAFIILICVLIATPLVQEPVYLIIVWFLLVFAIKGALLGWKLQSFMKNGILQWEKLIKYEEDRKNAQLHFFALFTNVKGLKGHSKRRKYLDFLLPKTKRTYEFLFSRSFLRAGDYLGLTVRLLILSVLALIFIRTSILSIILVAVLNVLLVFQLLALREAVDYQLFTRIYPLKKMAKNIALKRVLLRIVSILTVIELIIGLVFLRERLYLIGLVLVNFLLVRFYVNFRLKK
ncbi:ABC transporter permease [Lactococcus nasutitermitis]|uniref:ABC transporter permease n=1 Tax=Lactococcus nasutitermitis TaxID=1652957 RepID=A0ABV9JAW9_9LACT|nr:ABC transporter permease [Lactococcus nasutitermitis]